MIPPNPALYFNGMVRPIFAFLLSLCCASTLHAKDYSLLQNLPPRLSAARTLGHKGWDSSNTANQREATYRYNEALVKMMKGLVNTYYAKGFLPADQIDGYVKALYTTHRFEQNAGNPSGEFQGTMTYLDVPSAVAADLENIIAEMVQAIAADDPAFDYTRWKKSWTQARKR